MNFELRLAAFVHDVSRSIAQSQIMPAHDDWPAFDAPQFVQHHGQPFAGFVVAGMCFKSQLAAEHVIIHVGQFQRHHPQTHAPLPGFTLHPPQAAINVRFQVRWLTQAFGARVFVAVVVAHLHGQRPHAPAFCAHVGKEMIGHAAKHGFDIFLVGHIFVERLLLAE